MALRKADRIGEEKYNNQGCLMKIIEYNGSKNITVEFQDEYRAIVHTEYDNFKRGVAKNPFYKSVHNVGMLGDKYSSKYNNKNIKEYDCWKQMLKRCFYKNYKDKNESYRDVTCCKEWLLYTNFYEWLHKQDNFDKWLNGDRWAIDKDIIVKDNQVYSPETCCLVPYNVNSLFIKRKSHRGDLPIGVIKNKNKFQAFCENPFMRKNQNLGTYQTPEQAFQIYKSYKENIIKQVAEIEYKNGNITENCYHAMMNYKVEIDD